MNSEVREKNNACKNTDRGKRPSGKERRKPSVDESVNIHRCCDNKGINNAWQSERPGLALSARTFNGAIKTLMRLPEALITVAATDHKTLCGGRTWRGAGRGG